MDRESERSISVDNSNFNSEDYHVYWAQLSIRVTQRPWFPLQSSSTTNISALPCLIPDCHAIWNGRGAALFARKG